MAAATTWGIISATFTPTAGVLETFSDLTDISFKNSIQLQELLTDNNINVNFVFGTGGKTEVTLKSTDTSIAWRSTSPPGTPGILVLVFGKRAAGKGYVSAGNKTFTANNAVIGEQSGAAGASSAGSSDFPFTCYDPAGTGIFAIT